jgi:anti-sigma B factor antagonist
VINSEPAPGVPRLVREPRGARSGEIVGEQLIQLTVSAPADGTCVLQVTGEVDMLTAPVLDSTVATQLASRPRTLVLDLTGVEFMSSTGLASLMVARDSAVEIGCRLLLVCAGKAVLRPMAMTGLVDLFEIHADLRAALSA